MSEYRIVNWEQHQHADIRRTSGPPPWIKVYTRLLSDPAYLELTGTERAILHGAWLEHAKSQGKAKLTPSWLSRALNLRVRQKHMISLVAAGFLDVVASSVQAKIQQDASGLARARGEVEEEEEKTSSQVEAVVRPLDLDSADSDKENKEDEPFASEPEPALPPLNGTADGYGPQPLGDLSELVEKWKQETA